MICSCDLIAMELVNKLTEARQLETCDLGVSACII